ncbi:hypothetical protein FDB52_14500 [Clostridium botulinum]|nr:hypothetical protein [Clostridium botulinum]NFN49725.1 hypothetical protein [Clostridium botulinum]
MNWDEQQEILKLAFELRGNAGIIFDKNNELLKAANLFQKAIDYDDKLIKFWEHISKDKMNLAIINKEHLIYEKNFSLFFYNYRLKRTDDAFKYLELSNKALDNTLDKISNIISTINKAYLKELEDDRKRWTYYRLQNEPLYQALLAEKAIKENKLTLALDYYKSTKDKSEKLIEITKDYMDVLEPNYERIVLSNFYMVSSNYCFYLSSLERKDINIDSFNPIITESIIQMWRAYKYSIESVKAFPENYKTKEIVKNQLNDIDKMLLDNKKSWFIFLMKIKDDDFKIHLQQLNRKMYNKSVSYRSTINEKIGFGDKLISMFRNNKKSKYTYEETKSRIEYLKNVIENNDGYRLFYKDDELIGDEKMLQSIFKFTWYATEADVNRETNNGRGPVDYKISKGANDITLVEFKLASNGNLKVNLKNQVEIYKKANNTKDGLKVILYFTESQLKKVKTILSELNLTDDPNIYLIDARKDNKQSASKVR